MSPILRRFRRKKAALAAEPWESTSHTAQLTEQRRYVADVPYLLPKDALEDQRLNYQHYVLYRTISNHYLAPLTPESVHTILDVGTGTGIWPAEMARLFPIPRSSASMLRSVHCRAHYRQDVPLPRRTSWRVCRSPMSNSRTPISGFSSPQSPHSTGLASRMSCSA